MALRENAEQRGKLGFVGLIAAALLVGGAIAADGQAARTINGIAGLLWIAAGAAVVWSLRGDEGFLPRLLVSGGLTLTLVLITRPSDYLSAAIGFTVAGAVIAATAPGRERSWAVTVPALWLPVHLAVALARVADRALRDLPAHVRTEPPPTSALVPLVMVIAAWLGGAVFSLVRSRTAGQATTREDRSGRGA
jgi:hypothetical protein